MVPAGNNSRGLLIAVEGGDRCGKSTQCNFIQSLLQKYGHTVHCQKFPDRTTHIGGIINQYLNSAVKLNDRSIHLLFSANRWELRDGTIELLTKGTTILCDRYFHSGIAYTAAKGIDLDWCAAPDNGLPEPDLVVFLDAPARSVAGRAGYGEERYEKIEFQERVRDQFMKLRRDNWLIIDATQSVDKVSVDIENGLRDRCVLPK